MALPLEKPVKDFLNKFQKDLDSLQQTIKKESDDLVKRVKQAASKADIDGKRRELEQLVETKLKKFEPAINKFVHNLNVNARKAGVDLTELEQKVRSNLRTARTKLNKAGETVKARTTTKKATTKAAGTKKKATKKKTSTTAARATTGEQD